MTPIESNITTTNRISSSNFARPGSARSNAGLFQARALERFLDALRLAFTGVERSRTLCVRDAVTTPERDNEVESFKGKNIWSIYEFKYLAYSAPCYRAS